MTQARHTPAPWTAKLMDNRASKYWWSISDLDGIGNTICNTPNNTSESEANARLIAAAPELLEALEKCISVLEQNSYFLLSEVNAIEQAKVAITKATSI